MESDKRLMSVQAALEWAFGTECAQLELPDHREAEERGTGFGMEYVLIQRARLGTHVDGGGTSPSHPDADTIAGVVSTLSADVGGARMAIRVAEIARSGLTPDWMQGAVPKIEPREWGNPNRYGCYGKTERAGVFIERRKVRDPKNPRKVKVKKIEHEIRYTPCTWSPSQAEIEAARRRYSEWWNALDEIRLRLEKTWLSSLTINRVMPPKAPWASERLRTATAAHPPEA